MHTREETKAHAWLELYVETNSSLALLKIKTIPHAILLLLLLSSFITVIFSMFGVHEQYIHIKASNWSVINQSK